MCKSLLRFLDWLPRRDAMNGSHRAEEDSRRLAMKLNSIHETVRSNHSLLRAVLRELQGFRREERRGDAIMSAQQDTIIAEIKKAKTVSESTNVGMREVVRLLKEGQSNEDPTKTQEALDLLAAMQADDSSILKENTPEQPSSFQPKN